MIFFGPADFSQGIGKPCDFANEELLAARELVAKTARKYGKIAGTTGSAENKKELESMGYNFINVCADVVGLGIYFKNVIDSCK